MPDQVRACGLADFLTAFEGWADANVPRDPHGLDSIDTSVEALAGLDWVMEQKRVEEWRRKKLH